MEKAQVKRQTKVMLREWGRTIRERMLKEGKSRLQILREMWAEAGKAKLAVGGDKVPLPNLSADHVSIWVECISIIVDCLGMLLL